MTCQTNEQRAHELLRQIHERNANGDNLCDDPPGVVEAALGAAERRGYRCFVHERAELEQRLQQARNDADRWQSWYERERQERGETEERLEWLELALAEWERGCRIMGSDISLGVADKIAALLNHDDESLETTDDATCTHGRTRDEACNACEGGAYGRTLRGGQ